MTVKQVMTLSNRTLPDDCSRVLSLSVGNRSTSMLIVWPMVAEEEASHVGPQSIEIGAEL